MRQRGLITRDQSRAAGLGDSGIRHRIERGTWSRLRPGLFVVTGIPLTWEHEVLGAALLAKAPVWASHASSARVWGYGHMPTHPIELSVPLERRVRLMGVVTHRTGTLVDADVTSVAALPVLSAARTVIDLSARLTPDALEAMVDDGLRRRVLTLAGLHAVARRLHTIAPGRSPRTVERILSARTAGYHPGDSELERRVARAIVDAGLPAPTPQHRVVVGSSTYLLDLAYPKAKIAIEIDGFAFHHDRTSFDRDRTRQNDLVNAGWIVLRFTSRSTASEIVETVRHALFGRSSGA